MAVPLISGLSWGNITLTKGEIPEGSYTLRAYTKWMVNFGEDYVFKKNFYVASAEPETRFLTTDFKETKQADEINIRAGVLFTASFLIQARNKRGKSFNVGISVDEFKPPVFLQTSERSYPWYVNTDTLLLHYLKNKVIKQQEEAKLQDPGRMLKEVSIKDTRIVKDSKNLNGPGQVDLVLDEQDMLKAGKMTLGDLLKNKIKGFGEAYVLHSPNMEYEIYDENVHFVFDGVYLDKFYSPSGEANGLYQYIKQYLDYYTAEDITGIEVMYNLRYTDNYVSTFMSAMKVGDPIAFIEITTGSGDGPFMKKITGTYLYKPLPVTLPKEFYRPKYTINSKIVGTDLRSTIHWEPNIYNRHCRKSHSILL